MTTKANNIVWDYDGLESAARVFDEHHAHVHTSLQAVEGQVIVLQAGAWQGEATEQFFAAMRDDVIPALHRLRAALQTGHEETLSIYKILDKAENDAAELFKGEMQPPPPGPTPGPNPDPPASPAQPQSTEPAPDPLRQALDNDPRLDGPVNPDDDIPGYTLDMNQPLTDADIARLAEALARGEHIIFVIHGYASQEWGFAEFMRQFNRLFGDELPEGTVVIAIIWPAGGAQLLQSLQKIAARITAGLSLSAVLTPFLGAVGALRVGALVGWRLAEPEVSALIKDFEQANNNALQLGSRIGELITEVARRRDRRIEEEGVQPVVIDLIAHSLANLFAVSTINTAQAPIAMLVAIQAAVSNRDIAPGGALDAVQDPAQLEEAHVTNNPRDWALRARDVIQSYLTGQQEVSLGLTPGTSSSQPLVRDGVIHHSLQRLAQASGHYGLEKVWDVLMSVYGPPQPEVQPAPTPPPNTQEGQP